MCVHVAAWLPYLASAWFELGGGYPAPSLIAKSNSQISFDRTSRGRQGAVRKCDGLNITGIWRVAPAWIFAYCPRYISRTGTTLSLQRLLRAPLAVWGVTQSRLDNLHLAVARRAGWGTVHSLAMYVRGGGCTDAGSSGVPKQPRVNRAPGAGLSAIVFLGGVCLPAGCAWVKLRHLARWAKRGSRVHRSAVWGKAPCCACCELQKTAATCGVLAAKMHFLAAPEKECLAVLPS